MRLIVGLGNPGTKYLSTRHNIGFMVVEKIVNTLLPVDVSVRAWNRERSFSSELCKIDDLLICKPQTYMNKSGEAISSISSYYHIPVDQIWVVHDDMDLPLGNIRIRTGGGAGGHRGVLSLIENLGDPGFVRFRLGIGHGTTKHLSADGEKSRRQDIETFVVSPFTTHEAGDVKKLIKHASDAIQTALTKGIESAMNKYN